MNRDTWKNLSDLSDLSLGGNQQFNKGIKGEPDRNYRFEDLFFPNPNHVRSLALSALKKEHDNPINDSNPRYPGIRSKVDPTLTLFIRRQLEFGLDIEINHFEAWYHLTPGIHGQGLYHVDNFQLSGLIYLNDENPDPEESGTYIGKRIIDPDPMGQPYKDACVSHDAEEIRKFNVLKEEYNRGHFQTINVVTNYYNRLVAYEGKAPHAAGTYFGNDFDDSRLTLPFFYDTK